MQDSNVSMDVVVIGSVVYDLISYVDQPVKPGETRLGTKFVTGAGGKGANQCVMAKLLGSRTAIVGKIGDDSFGKDYMKSFLDYEIETDHLSVSKENHTGVASITVTSSGQNTIVVVPGSNFDISTDDIDKAAHLISTAKVVVCQLEIPIEMTVRALRIAKEKGVFTILNPAPAPTSKIPDILYDLVDIFCPNEQEAESITGLTCANFEDAKLILSLLKDRGCRCPMVTLGSSGVAFIDSRGDAMLMPAPKVDAIDTTGAGDAFVGSLAFYSAKYPQLSLEEKIRRSVRIASYSVMRTGTQSSYRRRAELPPELFG